MIPDSTASDFVLRTAAERGIRFIRLWFPDVLGLLKSCAIPVSELERALEEGVGIDGSSLESGARLIELDAIAQPDPTTFEVVPWRPAGDVARMFCDVLRPDGAPFGGDSRDALRRQLAKAAALGFTFQVGPELEFFLFADRAGDGLPEPLDDGSYFDLTPLDEGGDFRRSTIDYLERMGIPVKASHHEVGASQHELALKHCDGLAMADAVMTFRLTVREVARELGVHATFMPKPLERLPGSALHLHLSLLDAATGRNAFFAEGALLSELGSAFLAGLLRHARELTAVTNQWVNSYKRLAAGFEAPDAVCWSSRSGGALVRVPANRPNREEGARVELRSPDPGCNPYLAFAVVLAAGLRGVERGYELPPETLDEARDGLGRLPEDLREATDLAEESELVREALGADLHDWFIANKRREWAEYRTTVSEFERRRLLRLL